MEFRFACLSLFYKYIAPLEQLLPKIPMGFNICGLSLFINILLRWSNCCSRVTTRYGIMKKRKLSQLVTENYKSHRDLIFVVVIIFHSHINSVGV